MSDTADCPGAVLALVANGSAGKLAARTGPLQGSRHTSRSRASPQLQPPACQVCVLFWHVL